MEKMNLNRRARRLVFAASACVAAAHAANCFAADNIYSWVGPPTLAGNASWSTLTNWAGGAIPPLAPADGDNTIFWYGGALNAGTSQMNTTGGSTLAADFRLYQIRIDPYTVGGVDSAGTLTTTGAASRVIYLGAGGIVNTTTGASTFNLTSSTNATDRRLVLTADQTWTHSNTVATMIQRREMEGAFKVTKDGAGTIELQGANLNWTGGLDIQNGYMRGSTNTTVFGAGTISSISDNNTGLSASGSVDQTIAGPMVLGGTGSFAFRGSNAFNVNSTLTLTSNKTISSSVGDVTKPVTFNGAISGAGFVITKTGSTGLMIVKAANSHGGFNVAAGTLQASADEQLGAAGAPLGLSGGSINTGIFQTTAAFSSAGRAITLDAFGGTFHTNGFDSTFGAISGAGAFTKAGSGKLTVTSVHAGSLNVSEGGLAIAPNGNSTSAVKSLTVAGGAALDLADNDLVVDYDTTSPLGAVTDLIKSGRTSPNGIVSSAATTDKMLGVAEASIVLGASGGTFSGETVDGSAVLVKYTYGGDANLDGKVDVTDLGALATNWQTSSGWTGGDFNYDGFVDVTDLGALATNWQAGVGSPLGPGSLEAAMSSVGLGNVSVPEPAGLALTAVCFAAATNVRRRRRVCH